MSNDEGEDIDDEVMVTMHLDLAGSEIEAQAHVPRGLTRPRRMLPLFQAIAEVIVDRVVRSAQLAGLSVSCKAGCGACCRQLVPISSTEAHHLREVVGALDEPRRAAIEHRFAQARRQLADAGMLARLDSGAQRSEADLGPLAAAYFQLGIACPFLEHESCSIHPERPLSCREYLVTSPAERCASPATEHIDVLPLPGRVSAAVAALDESSGTRGDWIPLSLALAHADAHSEAIAARSGPQLLGSMLGLLSGRGAPG